MQILDAQSRCAEGNLKEPKGKTYPRYMTLVRKLGTIDITRHSGETKTKISCRRMDERKKFSTMLSTNLGVCSYPSQLYSYPGQIRQGNMSKRRILCRLILFLQEKYPDGGNHFWPDLVVGRHVARICPRGGAEV